MWLDEKYESCEILNFAIVMKCFLNMYSIWIYANKWVNDVIASQFSIYFVHRSDENSIFQLWESKTSFESILNICKIMFALIYFEMGYAFTCLSKKKKKKKKKTP